MTRVQGICKSCRPFCQLHGSFFWPLRRYFEGAEGSGERQLCKVSGEEPLEIFLGRLAAG